MKTICDYCGKEFSPYKNRIRKRNFCNRECWNASHRSAKEYDCENCGKKVIKTPGKIVGKIYCGLTCSQEASRKILKSISESQKCRIVKPCLNCGKKVEKRTSVAGKRFFCDNECKVEYESKQSAFRSRHPLYNTWKVMKARCCNPNNPKYPDYGGRGIIVCERWKSSFPNFLKDMGEKPTPAHSVDRVDNDGNYCPENCRWATPKEQTNNQRPKRKKAA